MTTKERYKQLFERREYLREYKNLYLLASVSGYFFQLINALTSFYFVFSLCQLFFGEIVALLVASACVSLLEAAKRVNTSTFIRRLFSYKKADVYLLFASIALVGFSAFASFKGSGQMIKAHAAATQQSDVKKDTTSEFERTQIAMLDKQINEARKDAYRGTTTIHSARIITKLADEKIKLYASVMRKDSLQEIKRLQGEKTRTEDTQTTAFYFALFTLFSEGLFLLCLYYQFRYKYHSANDRQSDHQLERVRAVYDPGRSPGSKRGEKASCNYCGKRYLRTHGKRVFCSDACRKNDYKRRLKTGNNTQKPKNDIHPTQNI